MLPRSYYRKSLIQSIYTQLTQLVTKSPVPSREHLRKYSGGFATDTGPRHAECNAGWIWYSEKRAQAQGLDSVRRGERELHAGAGTVTSVQAFGLCNVSNPLPRSRNP